MSSLVDAMIRGALSSLELANAPGTYQRLLENIFADVNLIISVIYVDNMIVLWRNISKD
jgi:hypothetical protein